MDIKHLVLDFELAVVKAYRHFFKDVTPRYCQFHFGQNINKKLRTFKGTPGYKDLHLCVSLSSLPADSVTESFLEVKKLIGSYSRSGKFIKYLESTYMKPNSRYPPQYWAGVMTTEGHTISNICESFHSSFGRLFGSRSYHPNIYLFMDNLNIHHRNAQIEYFTSPTDHSTETHIYYMILRQVG